MTTPLLGRNDPGLEALVAIVNHSGMVADWKDSNAIAFAKLFGAGARYEQATTKTVKLRAPDLVAADAGVPYAAFIHPSNQDGGPYSGMSFVVFPVEGSRCLVSLVLGTA